MSTKNAVEPKEAVSSITIRNCYLTEAQKARAIDLIRESADLPEGTIERDIAMMIKKTFDVEFGPKWHCAVGRHFASHVSYEPNCYLYAEHGDHVFLLFKSGGPKAGGAQ